MAHDDMMDGEGTEDTLNFFCRLPPERAKGIERKTTPPPMTWLHRILDSYEQPTNEVESQQTKRKTTDVHPRNRQQTDSSSVSSTSLRAGTSSRSSIADGSMFDEPEEAQRQEDDEEEEEEEAPWFSQLANLPQVRSAGVPLVAPSSTIPIGKRTMKESPAIAVTGGSGARRPYVNNRPVTSSYSRPATSAAEDGQASSLSTSLADGTSIGTSFNSSASSSVQHVDPYSTHESTSINSSRSSLLPPPTTIATAQSNGLNGTFSSTTASLAAAVATKTAQPLDPPDNFAMVNSWVYRSSFPKKRHFPFLQSLKLKSVLTLILEEYPEQNMRFLDENGITFFQFGIPGNKEPFVQIPHEKITAALVTIMDRRNHPMLIHCNKGKHRTGCLIGCLRKLQQWSLSTIFDEYRRFSFPKSRSMDQEFIELYREHVVWSKVQQGMLPRWAVLGKRVEAILDADEEDVDEQDKANAVEHPLAITPAMPTRQPKRLQPRVTGM